MANVRENALWKKEKKKGLEKNGFPEAPKFFENLVAIFSCVLLNEKQGHPRKIWEDCQVKGLEIAHIKFKGR